MYITQCTECKFQYRIPKSHIEMVSGRSASCKKCRARFIVKVLEIPDHIIEEENESLTENKKYISAETASNKSEPSTRSRRSRFDIRRELIKKLKNDFRALHSRLSEINKEKSCSEEEVRRWVVDALRHVFSYEDREIRTEERVNERKADIVVRSATDNKPIIVIEVKSIRHPLNRRVIDQVASYATILDTPYAIVTNGDAWIFFKCGIKSDKRKLIEIFNIALLDEDGISDDDAESLYLITKKSIESGYTERQSHSTAAIQPSRLLKAIMAESVLTKLRKTIADQYEEETGIKIEVDPESVHEHLKSLLIPDNL